MNDAAIERTWSTRIDELADEHPDEVALIVTGEAGGSLSWRELANRSAGVARLYAGRGVVQGSVVSILLPNSLAHVLATLAAWRLGATVLSMRHDLPPLERARMFELAQAAVVVTGTGVAANAGHCSHTLSAADVMAAVPVSPRTLRPRRSPGRRGLSRPAVRPASRN